ncbi:thiopeptide maturation pyridine synthase [Streptosporangium sp. NPDC051023]|uniref:thiopeptide maturation pyridine synthase n=1 Tax=Streptosporangium sp. NPDC051023 TaxID=3155410 RepID=UPI00344BBB81
MTGWYSAHVYYYDQKAVDDLILDTVRPLLEEIGGTSYFGRHWLRGPHVRIHVRTTEEDWEGRVRPLIDAAVRDHLSERPSFFVPDLEREQAVHRALAEMEQEEGPLEPWYPDNSVQYLPYDKRLHVLGTERASELVASFHTRTTPLAFALLQERREDGDLFDSLLTMMFASAHAACHPITKGFLSYRSHAEGFLANCGDPDGLRLAFDQRYDAHRDALAERMEAAIAFVDGDGTAADAPPHLATWVPIVRALAVEAEELLEAGALTLPGRFAEADQEWTAQGTTISRFHRVLLENEEAVKELDSAMWFAVYRVVLNMQYLLFSRLGVRPVERFALCHLTARTVEDRYDMPTGELSAFLAQQARQAAGR